MSVRRFQEDDVDFFLANHLGLLQPDRLDHKTNKTIFNQKDAVRIRAVIARLISDWFLE